jgi:hypothetical protein
LPFSLSKERVIEAVVSGHCSATGLKFDTSAKWGPLTPSIDRIVGSLGYTDENSQVVCWLYNRAKGDGTHADVMVLVKALAAPLPPRLSLVA